jgi:hypothetical protein
MSPEQVSTGPAAATGVFAIKDCALITIATGRKALNLGEFRDILLNIGLDSVYHHVWGGLLVPRFEEREFNNDFAAWASHGLHDEMLAERLALIDPVDLPELEDLRQEFVDIVEERLDESEHLHWVPAAEQFEFLRSQIVVFDTHKRAERPEDLARLIPTMSARSVFYHFIDARRRGPERTDDFTCWLSSFGGPCDGLCKQLGGIDPYFGSLKGLRQQLADTFATLYPEAH